MQRRAVQAARDEAAPPRRNARCDLPGILLAFETCKYAAARTGELRAHAGLVREPLECLGHLRIAGTHDRLANVADALRRIFPQRDDSRIPCQIRRLEDLRGAYGDLRMQHEVAAGR